MNDRCRLCGGPATLRHRGAAGTLTSASLSPTCHATGAYGDLYACHDCGTVHQAGLPDGRALVDLYRQMRDDEYLAEEEGRRATARRLLELVEAHAPRRGRLLEVGCGPGLLLDEASGRGWRTLGLEPSEASRAHALDLGLDVRDSVLENLEPAGSGRFEAIVMCDVLEHLEDPAGALRRCAQLLADGGVMLVVTPDPASLTARMAGARWWGYLPAHTFLVPRRTLRGLLESAGLDPVADRQLWRTFTLGYWIGGFGERGGPAGRMATLARRVLPRRRLVTLTLGDERVMLARRGVTAPGEEARTAARRRDARPAVQAAG